MAQPHGPQLMAQPGQPSRQLPRKCKYRVLAINGVEDDNFADVSPYLVATAADLPVPPATVTRDDPPSTKTAIEVHWSPVTSDDDTGGVWATVGATGAGLWRKNSSPTAGVLYFESFLVVR